MEKIEVVFQMESAQISLGWVRSGRTALTVIIELPSAQVQLNLPTRAELGKIQKATLKISHIYISRTKQKKMFVHHITGNDSLIG